MRDELESWIQAFPKAPLKNDGRYASALVGPIVREQIPKALKAPLPSQFEHRDIQGSIGQGDWAYVPWVAMLDPAETLSVEEGLYVVFLLSRGCKRHYLTLNQVRTTLKNESGIGAQQGRKV